MKRGPRALPLLAVLALASMGAGAAPDSATDTVAQHARVGATPASHHPPRAKVQTLTSPIGITVQVIASVPTTYVNSLGPPLPNPVSWNTVIHYSLAKPGNVSLKLYSITGQEAATLVDGFHDAGSYSVWWDGSGHQGRLAPGVYIYRMVSGSFAKARRIVLIR